MSEELYKKYRPKRPQDVVGQAEAMKSIGAMIKDSSIPHAILFTGPSGTGKTTIARMLAKSVKCQPDNFIETNAAKCRGIDEIRGIDNEMRRSPLGGGSIVYLIDECHGLTSDAQDAFLKMLEDTPPHVYFFLATTNPAKLKQTIKTRCHEVKCKSLTEKDLVGLVKKIALLEEANVSDSVIEKIAAASQGSARWALVYLNGIIRLADEEEMLASIDRIDPSNGTLELCRALMNASTTWQTIAGLINGLDAGVEAESARHAILGYARAVLLKSASWRAVTILECFQFDYYAIGKPGLVLSCWNVINSGKGASGS